MGRATGPHSEIMSREFRLILRFMGTDIDGTKKVAYGLGKIRGVGPNLAFAVVRAAKINPEARMGALSDGELSRVEDVIKDPLKHGIPLEWSTDARISRPAETCTLSEPIWLSRSNPTL